MKNRSKIGLIAVSAIIVAVVLGVGVGLFVGNNQKLEPTTIEKISAKNFEDPAAWGKNYPAQFESYQENEQLTDQPSHFEDMPYLKAMYAGTGYAKAFNHPRGHLYTLKDIRKIGDFRWKGHQAACYTCKSTQIPGLVEKYGDDFFKMKFDEVGKDINFPIGCANCHDPETNDLKITQPPLIEAMKARGIDVNKASRQEKRTLVCAQCHVTYYFPDDTNKTTFPWKEGLTVEDQIKYYDKVGYTEWTHPDSGAPMIKPRHEEYEYFKGSTHESAGVSCADCHMPYMKKGNKKVSSHVWQSPLDTMEQSCMTCHRESKDWLKGAVRAIQRRTKNAEDRGGYVVTELIETLKVAKDTPGIDQAKLKEAQRMHRLGQYYLDCVMVTNGYGFHNPLRSMEDLNKGMDYCQQGINIANQAILEAGGTLPKLNIKYDIKDPFEE